MSVHHDAFDLMERGTDGRRVLCGRLVKRGDDAESYTGDVGVTCDECTALLDEALQRGIAVTNGRTVELAHGPEDPRGGTPEELERTIEALRAMLAHREIVVP